jgi:hypothetical protein
MKSERYSLLRWWHKGAKEMKEMNVRLNASEKRLKMG